MPGLLLGTVLGAGVRQFLKIMTALGTMKQCDGEARELEESLGDHPVLSPEEPLVGKQQLVHGGRRAPKRGRGWS